MRAIIYGTSDGSIWQQLNPDKQHIMLVKAKRHYSTSDGILRLTGIVTSTLNMLENTLRALLVIAESLFYSWLFMVYVANSKIIAPSEWGISGSWFCIFYWTCWIATIYCFYKNSNPATYIK